VQPGGASLEWPGGEWALLALIVAWLALSWVLVRVVPALSGRRLPLVTAP
jgi:hypothetical protein